MSHAIDKVVSMMFPTTTTTDDSRKAVVDTVELGEESFEQECSSNEPDQVEDEKVDVAEYEDQIIEKQPSKYSIPTFLNEYDEEIDEEEEK